ncbi:MAG: sulfur oxidation c-type cytochrome SoxX [Beijerinckiaceae bacterium]|nr:sulfur oxidation c-type cytochrome SoxX [Beijerinckiaceae bacterium]
MSSASKALAPALLLTVCAISQVYAEALRPFEIEGDAIPRSLTGAPGDAARGAAIVGNRQLGLCVLCHGGPFAEPRMQGNLAPDLTGVGDRLSAGQLRLRMVDGSKINQDTIMPSYYRTDGLERVAPRFRDRTILSAEEIEDVVAYLAGLRN